MMRQIRCMDPSARKPTDVTKPDPNFIWSIADLLRGPYRPKEYGTVILPFTVLARLDAVLRPTKACMQQP